MMWHLLQALVGAGLLYGLRNDTLELGILGRSLWVVMLLALTLAVVAFTSPPLEWWQYIGAILSAAFVWTFAHGPVLSPPNQSLSDTPDPLEKAMVELFAEDEAMGWTAWLLYAALRYVAPCAVFGLFIERPLTMAAAGVAIVAGYWPVAYWLASGERTKYVGAAIAGAVFYGAL